VGKILLGCGLAGLAALPFLDSTPPASAMGDRPPMSFYLPNGLPSRGDLESLLVRSLLEIKQDRLDLAMRDIDAVLRINPNFRLAQLIKGDLLMARVRPINNMGDASGAAAQQVADLRDEARVRLQRHLESLPTDRLVPKYLVQFQPEQQYAVVVDTGKSRLYLFRNDHGMPHYVTDYYITTGKAGAEKLKEGDQKTPIGVYFVTASLPKDRLTDFYGVGAFPISYPNEWDKRQGKNGHGIWLHGVPSDTYSRPPRASNGCVVLTNQDMDKLGKDLQIGLTPVIISERIEWVDPKDLGAQRLELQQQLEAWRRDWETRNSDRYLGHYSRNFAASGQDYDSWARQKRQLNAARPWLKIQLSGVSMFRYPGRDNLMVVTFDQDYRSDTLNQHARKRQYWQLQGKQWKIVYEGIV
jgi:murein L,D-transpeptidase YafK